MNMLIKKCENGKFGKIRKRVFMCNMSKKNNLLDVLQL